MPGQSPGVLGQHHTARQGQESEGSRSYVGEELYATDTGLHGHREAVVAAVAPERQQPEREPEPAGGGDDMDDEETRRRTAEFHPTHVAGRRP